MYQKGANMNPNDPQSSNKNSKKPSDKPAESSPPTTPPLSSPNEPTRAYPSDPARNYSSDPSQYAYPNKPNPNEPSKVYTTEPLDTARVSNQETKSSESFAQKERESQRVNQGTSNRHEDPKKIDELYEYATSNRAETLTYVTYALLIIGLILLLFFSNLLGGLIIGMIAGYYFASEIIYYIRNMGQIVSGQDQLRYVVLTAVLIGLFIAAPGIFLGAAIVAAFKQVLAGPRDPSNRNGFNSNKPGNR